MEILNAVDGHSIDVSADGRQFTMVRIKAHQREELLLLVSKVLLRLPDGGDGFIDTTDGHCLQATHGATLINDNEVVDVSLLGVKLALSILTDSSSIDVLACHIASYCCRGILVVASLKRIFHNRNLINC